MLRVTTIVRPELVTFRLEGSLEGVWAQEVEKCWRSMSSNGSRRKVRVDLTGVTFVDELGKALLAAMHCQGVEFYAPDCLTKAIVEEVTGGDRSPTERKHP